MVTRRKSSGESGRYLLGNIYLYISTGLIPVHSMEEYGEEVNVTGPLNGILKIWIVKKQGDSICFRLRTIRILFRDGFSSWLPKSQSEELEWTSLISF